MRGWMIIVNAVYWLALSAWIGAIMTAGIAAACVFTTLPEAGVSLREYAAYAPPEEPGIHGRIAGGMVMERVFWIVDMIQFVAAPLLIVTLIVQMIGSRRRRTAPANLIRLLCVLVAAGTLAYQATALSPAMNRELRAYWAAAQEGRADEAQLHRANFDRDHPTATMLFNIRLLALLGVLCTSAAAFTPRRSAAAPMLERPDLLKRR